MEMSSCSVRAKKSPLRWGCQKVGVSSWISCYKGVAYHKCCSVKSIALACVS